jgi:ABC-type phosphate transport system auxiliary subunit
MAIAATGHITPIQNSASNISVDEFGAAKKCRHSEAAKRGWDAIRENNASNIHSDDTIESLRLKVTKLEKALNRSRECNKENYKEKLNLEARHKVLEKKNDNKIFLRNLNTFDVNIEIA